MKIVADQNIPNIIDAFYHFGEIALVDGRDISRQDIRDAEALIVRSVTKVNRDLLENSKVQFVGSATIGMDHVDQGYLTERNIRFSNAPGCNATSASEYVVAAVLYVAELKKFALEGMKVGVVGNGNVGSRTIQKLEVLGCNVCAYDPPRENEFHDREYVSWDEICACDIVTAHVPLTKTGKYPTHHMFNKAFFDRLKDGVLFINTSRGSVVDEAALKISIDNDREIKLVLDVWQNEPNIDLDLIQHALIATPHIAGYSREGKFRGLQMVYDAACHYFDIKPVWSMQQALPELRQKVELSTELDEQQAVYKLVKTAYDITRDDQDLRKIVELPEEQRGEYFDGLRKNYPVRREFFNYHIQTSRKNGQLTKIARGIGFTILK